MTLSDEMEADLGAVVFNTSDFGVSASISRRTTTITATIIVGSQKVMSRESQRAQSNIEISRNWVTLLVKKSDYDFGDGVVSPTSVDRFNINGRYYEPATPDGKEQCWEYTDGTSTVYKIYVEEVAA